MKKALLPALIAAMFAASSIAGAAERELLFGPEVAAPKAAKPVVKKNVTKAEPKQDVVPQVAATQTAAPAKKVEAPVVAKKEDPKPAAPVVAKKEDPKPAAPVVAVKKDEPKAPTVKKEDPKPAEPVVAKKEDPKPAAQAVVKKEDPKPAAPVVAKKEDPKPAAQAPVKKEDPKPAEPVVAKKEDPKPAAVAPAVAAAVPSMPALPVAAAAAMPSAPVQGATAAVKIVAGADPLAEREHLAATLTETITVGFFPSATGNNDNFSFQRNYLPLANFMSAQSHVLVNFVPERDLGKYRKNILEKRYPVVFINAALAREALKAGYVPAAVGEELLAPGFLVKSDSKFQKLEDLKDAKIAWSRNAQISYLAMGDLTTRKLHDQNTYNDVGNNGRVGAMNAVKDGISDVAVLRSVEVDKAVADSKGAYRSLGNGTFAPSSGVWIRADVVGNPQVQRMISALLQVAPDAPGAAGVASAAFTKGFQVKGKFVAPSPTLGKDLGDVLANAEKGFPDAFPQTVVSPKSTEKNLAMPALAKRDVLKSDDTLTTREALIAKMREGVNLGIFVPTGASQDAHTFTRNFMPLSNHLTDQAGVLVSLIPEQDPAETVRRLGDNVYPAVVVGPAMAYAAQQAGYVPFAQSGDNVGASFLVPVASTITKIEDLSGRRIAASRASDAATIGISELVTRDVKNTQIDFFGASQEGARILTAGAADAVVMRTSDAQAIVEKEKTNDGKARYRLLEGKQQLPAATFWVRKDLVDLPLMRRLSDTLGSFADGGSDIQQRAFAGYARGYSANGAWKASSLDAQKASISMTEGLRTAKQAVLPDPRLFADIQKKNQARPAVFPLVKTTANMAKVQVAARADAKAKR